MASISRLNTYKEQSSFYDAVAEKDANYVGKQIHAARKDLKISLEQFSQLLMQYGVEITRTALNKWELGKAVPSAYQLLAVCAALHLEDGFDYFVSNTKPAECRGASKGKGISGGSDRIREVSGGDTDAGNPLSGYAGQRPAGIRRYRRVSG